MYEVGHPVPPREYSGSGEQEARATPGRDYVKGCKVARQACGWDLAAQRDQTSPPGQRPRVDQHAEAE